MYLNTFTLPTIIKIMHVFRFITTTLVLSYRNSIGTGKMLIRCIIIKMICMYDVTNGKTHFLPYYCYVLYFGIYIIIIPRAFFAERKNEISFIKYYERDTGNNIVLSIYLFW